MSPRKDPVRGADTGTVDVNGEPTGVLTHGGELWHRHELTLADRRITTTEDGVDVYETTTLAHAHPGGDTEHNHDDLEYEAGDEVKGPDPDEWGDRPILDDAGEPVVEPDYEVKGPDPDAWGGS